MVSNIQGGVCIIVLLVALGISSRYFAGEEHLEPDSQTQTTRSPTRHSDHWLDTASRELQRQNDSGLEQKTKFFNGTLPASVLALWGSLSHIHAPSVSPRCKNALHDELNPKRVSTTKEHVCDKRCVESKIFFHKGSPEEVVVKFKEVFGNDPRKAAQKMLTVYVCKNMCILQLRLQVPCTKEEFMAWCHETVHELQKFPMQALQLMGHSKEVVEGIDLQGTRTQLCKEAFEPATTPAADAATPAAAPAAGETNPAAAPGVFDTRAAAAPPGAKSDASGFHALRRALLLSAILVSCFIV